MPDSAPHVATGWPALLAAARVAWGEGRAHDALQLCDRAALQDVAARHGAALLRGDIMLDMGDPAGALSSYESVADPAVHDAALDCARGLAHFELARFAEAENALHSALRGDTTLADAHFALGLIAEIQGTGQETEHFRRARRLQPARFPAAASLSTAEFEAAVDRALATLPAPVRAAMASTPVLVAELPRLDDLRQHTPPLSPRAFGTYVGLTRSHGGAAPGSGPGRPGILLFKRSLERACPNLAALVREIAATVQAEAVAGLGLPYAMDAEGDGA